MTSKNKYIKTLERFLEIMKSKYKPSFYENEKDQIAEDLITACRKADLYDELQSILEEYNVTPENIREVLLTGQMFRNQPTLEDCIKEWEERGFETIYHENHIIFRHHKTYKVIEIDSINLSYKTDEWYDPKRPYADRLNIDEIQYITLDLHKLLSKTLKALEEMKDE